MAPSVEGILAPEHVILPVSAETDDVELFARHFLDSLRGHSLFAEELERWNLDIDVSYRGIRLRRQGGGPPTSDTDDLFWS